MLTRRSFISSSSASLAASALAQSPARAAGAKIMIGLDHFAVRAAGMKAPQLIDYAASLKLDTLFLSELGPFESTEDDYLKMLKAKADAANLKLYTGGMSICETSNTWKKEQGTAEAYLTHLIHIAKTLGSPVARCVLGNQKDRGTDGGIDKHIENVIKACQACKTKAQDAGVRISVENHAGDMRASELKMLVEAAGKDYVGVNIDPGNAVWAMDDPMQNLEILGPYVNCSSVRDSMVWEDENGAVVQWTAIGEGLVDFKAYAKRFAELAPGVPLNIETISGFSRPIPYKSADYMKMFPNVTDRDLAAIKALAKRGKKKENFKAPDGPAKKDAETAYQKGEFERSVKWLRENV